MLSLLTPNTPKLFGMYGGDDGARTRDLCRDSESTIGNLLIIGAMDGHSKNLFKNYA